MRTPWVVRLRAGGLAVSPAGSASALARPANNSHVIDRKIRRRSIAATERVTRSRGACAERRGNETRFTDRSTAIYAVNNVRTPLKHDLPAHDEMSARICRSCGWMSCTAALTVASFEYDFRRAQSQSFKIDLRIR